MLAAALSNYQIVTLFACAGLTLYLAGRAAVDALTSLPDPSPGRMAVAHWMPIAWSAVLATLAGHWEIGITLTLATSVASLALVLGVLLCVGPDGLTGKLPKSRGWPLVLPAAVLVFLAGFSGTLNWVHNLMLLALGGCILAVWLEPERADESIFFAERMRGTRPRAAGSGFDLALLPAGAAELDPPNDPPALREVSLSSPTLEAPPPASIPASAPPAPSGASSTGPRARYWRAQLLLAVALGAAGGWMGYKGIMLAEQRTRFASTSLIALAVLSPLLVLSLLGTGATVAHSRRFGSVLATLIAVVMLNLCLLLPIVAICHYIYEGFIAWHAGAGALGALSPMPFPITSWRVDSVLLIVMGLMVVPVSLGRWRLGRLEGLALVIIYAAYLVTTTALAVRL